MESDNETTRGRVGNPLWPLLQVLAERSRRKGHRALPKPHPRGIEIAAPDCGMTLRAVGSAEHLPWRKLMRVFGNVLDMQLPGPDSFEYSEAPSEGWGSEASVTRGLVHFTVRSREAEISFAEVGRLARLCAPHVKGLGVGSNLMVPLEPTPEAGPRALTIRGWGLQMPARRLPTPAVVALVAGAALTGYVAGELRRRRAARPANED